MQGLDFIKSALNLMDNGIYYVDKELNIMFWNKGAELITGFSATDVLDSCCRENILNHVSEDGTPLCVCGCPLGKTLADGQEREQLVYLHHKQGQRVKIFIRTTPIFENGEIIGAVEVFSRATEQKLLKENKENFDSDDVESLRLLALYDQLTGVPNRRYMDSILANKMSDYATLGVPCAVVMGDIDDFRVFNNTYGHLVGDSVLKMVATTLANAMGQEDVVGRWGGEEFLAVLSNDSEEEFIKTMERMRMLVSNSLLRENGVALGVTISIGGAFMRKGETAKELIERADKQLYESKAKGKNCVNYEI